jgi:hypothetical protein
VVAAVCIGITLIGFLLNVWSTLAG